MFGLDIGIGAVVGKVLGLGKSWMDGREHDKQRKHELAVMEIEEAAAQREKAHEVAMFKLGIEGKIQEAESRLDVAEVEVMGTAIAAQGEVTGIGWIDGISKTVRPFVTYIMLGMMIWLTYEVYGLVDGLEAFDHSQLVVLFQKIVHEVLFLTSSVISFWFTIRTRRAR